ncbi:hypothetical protein BDN70DRAFT_881366 [Pholiota conissans]|uniref:Uncharacterized protein n=1 Tax=Pholiota conissans TaxID=109636 RepID=A0A9P5Z0J8_9AGAR|nr:hypothetical protein BDN70DRAFT_881366 [Pholiota conissans]
MRFISLYTFAGLILFLATGTIASPTTSEELSRRRMFNYEPDLLGEDGLPIKRADIN